MEIGQRIFLEPRFGEFAVLVGVGDDGPDLMLAERLVDRTPGVARLGGLAWKAGVRGEQNFHR